MALLSSLKHTIRFGIEVVCTASDFSQCLYILLRAFTKENCAIICEPNPCHGEVVAGLYCLICNDIPVMVIVERSHRAQYEELYAFVGASPFYLRYRVVRLMVKLAASAKRARIILASSYDYFANKLIFNEWLPLNRVLCQMCFIQHDLGQPGLALFLNDMPQRINICRIGLTPPGSKVVSLPLTLVANRIKKGYPWKAPRSLALDKSGYRCDFVIIGSGGQDLQSVFLALQYVVRHVRDVSIAIIGDFKNTEAIAKIDSLTGIRLVRVSERRTCFSGIDNALRTASYIIGPVKHLLYSEYKKVSGSLQLSRAYRVPMIINSILASEWGMGRASCISYERNELKHGLHSALTLSHTEYVQMVSSLDAEESACARKSKATLLTMLK